MAERRFKIAQSDVNAISLTTIGHCLQAHTELLGSGTWIDSDPPDPPKSPHWSWQVKHLLIANASPLVHKWDSQVLYVQPSELHTFVRNISAQISGVPGFPSPLEQGVQYWQPLLTAQNVQRHQFAFVSSSLIPIIA